MEPDDDPLQGPEAALLAFKDQARDFATESVDETHCFAVASG